MSLYRRRDTPFWWCRFQLDGREIRLSTRTQNRKQAEAFETLSRSRAYENIRLGNRPDHTWKEAASRWLTETRKRSKDVDERIIAWLSEQIGDASLSAIDREVIDQLRGMKAEEQSESTADRYMALLRSILKKAADDWQWIDKAPKVPMYRPERPEPRWLTHAEFDRLVKELPPHLKSAAQFAVLTGLRMRAMLSLRWDQVDLKAKRAWIGKADMKGKQSHGLPLSPDAITVLTGMPRKGPWVFQWRGKRVGDCNGKAFKDAVKAAKVAPLRWHDLRHTWASWAVQAGVSLHEVMMLGGWKSLAMVMRYSHLSQDHLAGAAAKVSLKNRHSGTVARQRKGAKSA